MPTYEYECKKCAHIFEKFQSINAQPVKKCPKCSGTVKRLIGSGSGIIFKGSGFYITDHRSEGYKKAQEKDKPKTESKPAAKDKDKSCG